FVNEDYVIREYYNFKFLNPEKNKEIQQNTVRGSVELYGIPFKVIIPSMKNNEIESIYLKELSGGEFDVMRSCNQVCDNAEGIRKHYIFGGIRDKIECCVDPSIGNCIIKQNQPIDAKKAVCPGAYLAPSDKIGDGDRICIIPDIDWPEIMEKPFCLQIPRKGCDEINLISPVTLNAAWSALKSGETGYGRCPTEIGMESQKIVSFKDAHDCGTQSNQKNAYKDFQALINRAQSENRNVYKEEINRIAHKNSCSSINFSEKEVKIKRKCYINFYAPIESDVEGENGECRMKMGCAEISDITISQYNTLWPETKPINPEDAIKTIDEKYNIITQSKIVYGTCPEGYKSIDDQGKDVSWKPYRNCIGKYYYDAKEKKKKLLYSYWGEVIGSCTRDKNLQ
ncbi:MAG: hypothetical protein O3C05_02695, partial [Proteobacteria bacterium]|nr:hypothetical protein [Pseudomonadota bacterium]